MRVWVLLYCMVHGACHKPITCEVVGTYTTEGHALEALQGLCGDSNACYATHDIQELDVTGVHIDGCDDHE